MSLMLPVVAPEKGAFLKLKASIIYEADRMMPKPSEFPEETHLRNGEN